MCRSDPTRILLKDLLFQFTFSPNHKVIRMWIKYTYIDPCRKRGIEPIVALLCLAHLPLSLSGQSNPAVRFDHPWMGRDRVRHISMCGTCHLHLIRRSISAPQETETGVPIRTDLSYLSLQDGSFSVSYSSKSELDDRALQILFC